MSDIFAVKTNWLMIKYIYTGPRVLPVMIKHIVLHNASVSTFDKDQNGVSLVASILTTPTLGCVLNTK